MKARRKTRRSLLRDFDQFEERPGRVLATAYRYGRWGRTLAIQCPLCKNFIESPFSKGFRWELWMLIIRKRIECPICAIELRISAKYKIIEEDEEDNERPEKQLRARRKRN